MLVGSKNSLNDCIQTVVSYSCGNLIANEFVVRCIISLSIVPLRVRLVKCKVSSKIAEPEIHLPVDFALRKTVNTIFGVSLFILTFVNG